MSKPRFSNIELVSPINSPLSTFLPSFGGRVQLSSTDRVLVENGGNGYRALDIYLSLFLNPVVYKSWDKVMSEVCSRELQTKPYDDSKEAKLVADFVQKHLLSLGVSSSANPLLPAHGGVDELTRALGMAYITGISPVELVWGRNSDGKRVVQYFKPRDPRLFRMEYDTETNTTRPRLITRTDVTRGIPLPAHKFIFHRYWALPNDDDYGCGIGRNLYYPVEWQKQLMSYWLMAIDKSVMPSTIGSVSAEARPKDGELDEFKEAVRNFGQDSSIVLAPGFSIDVKDLRIGSIDVLEKLIERIDTYIEDIIVGESGTGKSGAGSQAKDQVSNSIRIASAKAMSDSISETLNQTLVKWLVRANFGSNAPMPTVWRNFAEDIKPVPSTLAEVEDIEQFVQLLSSLNQINLNLDRDYVQSRLGAPLKSTAKPTGSSQGTALFSNVPSPAELLGK